MAENITIPRNPSAAISENFLALRAEGISLIQQLSGFVWTDHNLHDPGVTILEALCYAITELGYRSQLEIRDLLTSSRVDPDRPHFFTAGQILPCAPVTIDDYRKLLIDLPALRNAWLEVATRTEPPFFFDAGDPPATPPEHTYATGSRVSLNGLYEVLLEFSDSELGDLNSTILTVENIQVDYVDADLNNVQSFHDVEFSFPFWDEAESEPFRVIRTIDAVTGAGGVLPIPLLQAGGGEINNYFAGLEVAYDGGAGQQHLGVSLTVTTTLSEDPNERQALEVIISSLLADTGPDALVVLFNQKVAAAFDRLKEVVARISTYRNVSEDIAAFRAVRIQEIGVNAIIEVKGGLDVEDLLANIFFNISTFLAPGIKRYTLSEMEAAGIPVEEILEGPLLENGFIKTDELRELDGLQGKGVLFTSDLLRIILETGTSVPTDTGEQTADDQIVSVRELNITNFVRNKSITQNVRNCLLMIDTRLYKPRLSPHKSNVVIIQNDLEIAYDFDRVVAIYETLRSAVNPDVEHGVDALVVPEGDALALASYQTIQNDFPVIYGIGEGHLSVDASDERRAQAMQLKAYLLFFEQILANEYSQVANLDEFFSIFAGSGKTYFSQELTGVPGLDQLLFDLPAYAVQLESGLEDRFRNQKRRTQLLDHLLARFGEEMNDYALMKYTTGTRQVSDPMDLEARRLDITDEVIAQKARFLRALHDLNGRRGQGFDYFGFRRNDQIRIELLGSGDHRWFWDDYFGTPRLRSPGTFPDEKEARAAAEAALVYGTNASYYQAVAGDRFQLFSDLSLAPADLVAESATVFATLNEGQDAIDALVPGLRYVWNTCNVSGLERKLSYLLDFRTCTRRQLSVQESDLSGFIEVVDVDIGGGVIRQRFVLLRRDGAAVLDGQQDFTSAADARQAAFQTMRVGLARRQYEIFQTIDDLYQFRLLSEVTPQVEIALRSDTFDTQATAERAIQEAMDLFHELYGRTGFHMVEHVLLRPRDRAREGLLDNPPVLPPGTIDEFLIVRDGEGNAIRDPYSFRVSFIFPSGNAFDFQNPPADAADREEAPAVFRDPEYRRYAELTIRRELPANVVPRVFWLDVNTGTVQNDELSLNRFESLYRVWLEAKAAFELPQLEISDAQNELVRFMNELDASLIGP